MLAWDLVKLTETHGYILMKTILSHVYEPRINEIISDPELIRSGGSNLTKNKNK